jgi:small subunit ribosomal protein S15
MAKLYSKKKGKSGSTRPVKRVKPSWVDHDAKTVEQLVVKLAKAGKTSAEIGSILRDTYSVPDVKAITKKSITTHLKEQKLQQKLPEDLRALIKRDVQIMKHLEVHKQDMTAKRGLQLTESKIGRLVIYYKKTGELTSDWTYDKTKAKTFID